MLTVLTSLLSIILKIHQILIFLMRLSVYGGTRIIQVYDNATAGLIDQTVPSGD